MPEIAVPPSPDARYVFVYGTLRRGASNDITLLHPTPRWVGAASVLGVMYHLGHYPGVLLGGACVVTGEVYEISAEVERQLDEIEEVWPQQTGEYAKREVSVQLNEAQNPGEDSATPGARALRCIVYEINPERVAGRTQIEGGDWVKSTAPPDLVEVAKQI